MKDGGAGLLVAFGACSVTCRVACLCDVPSRGTVGESQCIQSYPCGINVESVHIQNLNIVPSFFVVFSSCPVY